MNRRFCYFESIVRSSSIVHLTATKPIVGMMDWLCAVTAGMRMNSCRTSTKCRRVGVSFRKVEVSIKVENSTTRHHPVETILEEMKRRSIDTIMYVISFHSLYECGSCQHIDWCTTVKSLVMHYLFIKMFVPRSFSHALRILRVGRSQGGRSRGCMDHMIKQDIRIILSD